MPDDLNEVLMSEEETEKKPLIRVDWKKLPPAFWTVTSVISLTVNVILIAVLLTVGWHIFQLKPVLNNQVLYGLYDSFVKMDQAHIQTTIPVETNVPAKFDLILDTDTTVILNEDTLIKGATVDLLTGGLTIRQAPSDIILPAGTNLPIHLSLTVPVDQTIPVVMDVAVDIPLSETDMHEPLVNLQEVIRPLYIWLWALPNTPSEAICGYEPGICRSVLP